MKIEPEFRRDPVCGRWTVIAPERSDRPRSLEGAEPRHRRNGERKPCPFCPGQEYDTPNEVLADRTPGTVPDGPGWQLRVVPNKFPAVRMDLGEPARPTEDTIFLTMPGIGRAEVIIECPEHLPDPTELSDSRFSAVFRAYRDRMIALAEEPRLAYAAIFKNVGAEAGASLGHTHSQIIATPIIPGFIETELASAGSFFSRSGRCVFCDILRNEEAKAERIIDASENFVAIAAFAPRFDYEFWVLPRTHLSRYETISDPACLELAQLTKRLLRALDRVLDCPAYNWFLHTAPLRSRELQHYHWHIEVMPRTARPAGLEWGFDCSIVSQAPEKSARIIREAIDGNEWVGHEQNC